MGHYLERVLIESYGALRDFELGPLGPGMNVVFGPNEAGKSTVASFVGGVLFGWEEAHGVRNTYRPAEGERAGSLVFAEDGSDEKVRLSRRRNEDGLQGNASLVADLDHATYRTMFSLTSDELRSLRTTSDVMASLLSAGSGTGSSPSAAFVEVDRQIAETVSSADADSCAITQLLGRLEDQGENVEEERAANELYKQEDRERADLANSIASTTARLDALNEEVERLHATRARIETLDAQAQQRKSEIAELEAERMELAAAKGRETGVPEALLNMDASSERLLREQLEEFSDEQEKLQRIVDMAQENSASSTASYEALVEMDVDSPANERRLKGRTSQVVVSILLPLAFIASGIPLFMHGRVIRSLSFTALGVGLVVLACFMAAAALVVLLRPNREAEALEARRKDAQWAMLQDKKKLDASLDAKEQLERRIAEFLADAGLEMAGGSVRQARALLDDAREGRSRMVAFDQRLTSLGMRADIARNELAEMLDERAQAMVSTGLAPDAPIHALEGLARQRSEERDVLTRALADMNQRFGELGQRLEAAREDHAFYDAKLEFHQLRCRLREQKRRLVVLLLARRMLEKSMGAWESRNQPAVYEQASRLFGQLTGGAWTHVSMTAEGRLVASSPDGVQREVHHLSLGTCQQLYLALRVAMLMQATSVGASIPVLADDILVNFDASRRRAAAQALSQLARARQVIVFTCHRETARILCEAASDAVFMEM